MHPYLAVYVISVINETHCITAIHSCMSVSWDGDIYGLASEVVPIYGLSLMVTRTRIYYSSA